MYTKSHSVALPFFWSSGDIWDILHAWFSLNHCHFKCIHNNNWVNQLFSSCFSLFLSITLGQRKVFFPLPVISDRVEMTASFSFSRWIIHRTLTSFAISFEGGIKSHSFLFSHNIYNINPDSESISLTSSFSFCTDNYGNDRD